MSLLTVLSGGDWKPSDYAKTELWWRGDLGQTIVDGKFSDWEDQIKGAKASQSTATARPTLVQSSPIFGQPAPSFDGSDELIVTNAEALDVYNGLDTGIMHLIVLEDVQSQGTHYIYNATTDVVSASRCTQLIAATRKLFGSTRVNNDAKTVTNAPASSGYATGDDFLLTHLADFAGRSAVFNNETEIHNLPTGFTDGDAFESSTPSRIFIGSANNQFFLTALIHEIIVVEIADETEALDVLNNKFKPYLNARYSGLNLGTFS